MSHINKQDPVKKERGSHTTNSHAEHKHIIEIYTQSKQNIYNQHIKM